MSGCLQWLLWPRTIPVQTLWLRQVPRDLGDAAATFVFQVQLVAKLNMHPGDRTLTQSVINTALVKGFLQQHLCTGLK